MTRIFAKGRNLRVGKGCRGAFTLVELLVVIGVIAVLVGILLPVLSSVRRQADTLRCASNLRQIGLGFFQYGNDHKGTWPVTYWRPKDGDGAAYHYKSDPAGSKLSRPWYWHMFLQPYVSRGSVRDADSATDPNYIARNPVLWGCSQWRPWTASKPAEVTEFGGPVDVDEIGYGMNWSPTFTANFPSQENQELQGPGFEIGTWGGSTESTTWLHRAYYETYNGKKRPGRFYKQREWTQPSERGLVGDCEYFQPKAELVPPGGYPWYGQRMHIGFVPFNMQVVIGVHNIDFFRHTGKMPREDKDTPGFYDGHSGVVGTNMLYCDGHVATLHTYEDVYMAYRRRFPE